MKIIGTCAIPRPPRRENSWPKIIKNLKASEALIIQFETCHEMNAADTTAYIASKRVCIPISMHKDKEALTLTVWKRETMKSMQVPCLTVEPLRIEFPRPYWMPLPLPQ